MPWIWPRLHVRSAALMLGLCLVFGLVGAHGFLANGSEAPLGAYMPFLTGSVGVWVALPIPMTVALNVPDVRSAPLRALSLYGVGFVALTLLTALVRRGLVALLSPWLGIPSTSYALLAELGFDLPASTVSYIAMVSAYSVHYGLAAQRAAREHAARVERELAETQLSVLRARLEPEQLFAALASVRSSMRRDRDHAERTLVLLGDQLRSVLHDDAAAQERARGALREHLCSAEQGAC
jgi:hypothetical protein